MLPNKHSNVIFWVSSELSWRLAFLIRSYRPGNLICGFESRKWLSRSLFKMEGLPAVRATTSKANLSPSSISLIRPGSWFTAPFFPHQIPCQVSIHSANPSRSQGPRRLQHQGEIGNYSVSWRFARQASSRDLKWLRSLRVVRRERNRLVTLVYHKLKNATQKNGFLYGRPVTISPSSI